MSEPFDDIARAMHVLRAAFIKNGMKPPVSIELGNYEDGDRFRWMMPRDLVASQGRLMDNAATNPEWVASVYGVEVRMPAKWRLERSGNKRLV